MLMRYDQLMTIGTPKFNKLVAVSVPWFFVCGMFLVTYVGELTHLRPLHTLMSQVEKH